MLFIYQMGKFELCMTFEVTTTKIARVYNRGDSMIWEFYGPPTAAVQELCGFNRRWSLVTKSFIHVSKV